MTTNSLVASSSLIASSEGESVAAPPEIPDRILSILNDYFADAHVRAHFFDISTPLRHKEDEKIVSNVLKQLLAIFCESSEEERTESMKKMIDFVTRDTENNGGTAHYIVRRFIAYALENRAISLRYACECFINIVDFKLRGDSAIFTFDFLLKNLEGLDYKGVRDVLKQLLEKVQLVPHDLLRLRYIKMEKIEDVILAICDREKNHLPAYFVMNELQRISSSPQHYRCFTIPRLAQKFADVLESFRPLAELTCTINRPFLVPVLGHIGLINSSVWKLDSQMKLVLKGLLPWSNDYVTPQSYNLYQVLSQPHGWDLFSTYMTLSNSRQNDHRNRMSPLVEQTLALALVQGMIMCQHNSAANMQYRWRHLTITLVRAMVHLENNRLSILLKYLHDYLSCCGVTSGRDDLMWALLQYIGGCLDKLFADELLAVVELYKLLYNGQEEFVVDDANTLCVRKLAATDVWIHITRRLTTEMGANAPQPPLSIRNQIKFFEESVKKPDLRYSSAEDERSTYPSFMLPALFNAYSGNVDICDKYLLPALKRVWESDETTALPMGPQACNKLRPLPIQFFDALSFHAKMTIQKCLRSLWTRRATNMPLPSPAGVDSYARLIAISEPTYVVKLLAAELQELLVKGSTPGVLHTFLEMLTFRIPTSNVLFAIRYQTFVPIVRSLSNTAAQSVASPMILQLQSNPQLYFLAEQFLLRQILWTSNNDWSEMLLRSQTIAGFSREQYNRDVNVLKEHSDIQRVIVLFIARTLTMCGGDNGMEYVERMGPMTFPASTLKLMPHQLTAIFSSQAPPYAREQHTIKQQFDEDYIKWRSALSEDSLIEYFTRPQAYPMLLCVLWQYLVDGNKSIPQFAYRILAELKPKVFVQNLHKLLDMLALKISTTADQNLLNKMVACLDQLIWKFWVIPLDRFLLSACTRHYDGKEMQGIVWVIRYLLVESNELDRRIKAAHTHLAPENGWTCDHWFEALKEYYNEVGPTFCWGNGSNTDIFQALPVYYGHIVGKLVPIMDLLLQRLIEYPQIANCFEMVVDKLAIVFRFHPQPGLFLYNLLFWNFEAYLVNYPERRRKLVSTVLQHSQNNRPANWLLTQQFRVSLTTGNDWSPTPEYYMSVVNRVIEGFSESLTPPSWAERDWRLSQFAGPASQAVHCAAVEFMASQVPPEHCGEALVRLVVEAGVPRAQLPQWINATALVLMALPPVFHTSFYDAVVFSVQKMVGVSAEDAGVLCLNSFQYQVGLVNDCQACRTLSLAHAVWNHASCAVILKLATFVHERLSGVVQTESQLLYVARLIVPVMQRLFQENTKFSKYIMEMSTRLYEMLLSVDRQCECWSHMDTICDLFYHLKYMYVGDGIKPESDAIIAQLRPELQNRLRFISHHQNAQTPMQTQ